MKTKPMYQNKIGPISWESGGDLKVFHPGLPGYLICLHRTRGDPAWNMNIRDGPPVLDIKPLSGFATAERVERWNIHIGGFIVRWRLEY